MDDMTASAGEIIALALQEQIGAKLVGTTTFGKGSIQTMELYDNGDSLKYTIGKRYSPSDKNIDKVGVAPDVEVSLDIDTYLASDIDNQLETAKEVLASMIK
jgi:carboxyl-terminal processing protease